MKFSPQPPHRAPPPRRAHDDDEAHFHELSEETRSAIAEVIWKTENIELTTVGIDIGSSTSHLMFARVHLQRKTQLLSSEFVVVSREIVWRSPILFTPFVADDTIDAARLRGFVEDAYRSAGFAPEDIDSGAVILTGEAIKRKNAQAIAQIFSADAGKFVCASAGHHMECVLAAHGAGATAISRRTHRTILNIDIGGGTTKFALVRNGEIAGTCAVAVGGRLVAFDAQGALVRIEDSARQAAAALGFELRLGDKPDAGRIGRLVDALAGVVIDMICGHEPEGWGKELLLTGPLPVGAEPHFAHFITFSGGVAEYIYGRESSVFGDIAQPLAARVLEAFASGRIATRRIDPGQGIRATVIGASQFTLQVSGNTIHRSSGVALPVRNVPVAFPALGGHGDFEAVSVAAAVRAALERIDADESLPIALGLRWHGDPHYARLRSLAEGIAQATCAAARDARPPLFLMIDGDIGKLLGHILEDELRVPRPIVSIDGIHLRELDYVDIGEAIQPSGVVPVIIKSLLFPRQ